MLWKEVTVNFVRHPRTVWLFLSLCLVGIVSVLTLMPMPDWSKQGSVGIDKVYHILAFAALIWPTACLLPQLLRPAGFFLLAYGGLIELIQPLVGRSADSLDLLADGLGILLGASVGLAMRAALRRLMRIKA
ncbi:VanZ like family protein [Thalassovita litoralis]|jgi:VanZ family protein|uniref:VanZ like family protein n=1 Tax=Thalassovita litoralis TaxID=1010611 RepID=A0A521EBF0_9RHOB|nr:VanZ family protein [Thalassovita litoralis]SMO80791.1 VanZ like family protein [Thalassovita litoralis]